jgi:hypothetical protein
VIIELLSTSTEKTDKNLKKVLYQDRFRTPEYFLFSPEALTLTGYRLVNGQYEAIAPNPQGHLWSQSLELSLGVQNNQLRYFSAEGDLVPTPEEAAIQAESQAQAMADRAARLAAQLKAAGLEPEA